LPSRRSRHGLVTVVLALSVGVLLDIVRRLSGWTGFPSRGRLLSRPLLWRAWQLFRNSLMFRTVAIGLVLWATRRRMLLDTLTSLRARLDAIRGARPFRCLCGWPLGGLVLGGWLIRVACTHLSSSWTPGPSVTRVGSRVTVLLPTRARNPPQPRSRSNWNHHLQHPRLQALLLLQLSQD
jgi:hypothetical protein